MCLLKVRTLTATGGLRDWFIFCTPAGLVYPPLTRNRAIDNLPRPHMATYCEYGHHDNAPHCHWCMHVQPPSAQEDLPATCS
jgi:hypothetical protein